MAKKSNSLTEIPIADRRGVLKLGLGIAGGLLVGCEHDVVETTAVVPNAPPAATGSATKTLVIYQASAVINYFDVGGDSFGSGDVYAWNAPITAEDGRAGSIAGVHQTVTMPTDGLFREVRIGYAAMDFGNGDTIVFGGLIAGQTPGPGLIAPGVELVNAIIAGAGAFGGAKGEIRSVRAPDNSWTHTLFYRTADLVAPPRRQYTARLNYASAVRDTTGNGRLGAGDFLTYLGTAQTADGISGVIQGAYVFISDRGQDGTPPKALGYGIIKDGDNIVINFATNTPSLSDNRLLGKLTTATAGGTGQTFGVTGEIVNLPNTDGSIQQSVKFFTPRADLVDRSFVLRSRLPTNEKIDRGSSGDSAGDQWAWVLPFTGDRGESATAFAYTWTIVPAGGTTAVRSLLGLILMRFSDGSTLLVADARTENAVVPTAADVAVRRPVLGGTGIYAGVWGELVTSLDGTSGLVHQLNLRGPAPGTF